MASYNQCMKLVAWALTLAVVVHTAASVSGREREKPPRPVPLVTVAITNDLEGKENLQVHCKDAKIDYGVNQVPYGATYSFRLRAIGVEDDYFCGFIFNGVLHWFDIYLGSRDEGDCSKLGVCAWSVKEAGPCLRDHQCSVWN